MFMKGINAEDAELLRSALHTHRITVHRMIDAGDLLGQGDFKTYVNEMKIIYASMSVLYAAAKQFIS